MQFLKVTCVKCTHYNECPKKTRLFVNYCGSDRKRVEGRIHDAVIECVERQGRLFKRTTFKELHPVTA
jgi:hypothetical protein